MKKYLLTISFLLLNFAAIAVAQTVDIKKLTTEAQKGKAEAQNELGNCYKNGVGVEKNMEKAAEWYRKAADQGEPQAQNSLGFLYHEGLGVVKSKRLAVSWFKKAAEKGLCVAQFNLAYCYETGFGVETDLEQATVWYRKAADQGDNLSKEALKRIENQLANSEIIPDVVAFELKGKVKSCEVSEIGAGDIEKMFSGNLSAMLGTIVEKYSFTANGKYIPQKGEEVFYLGNAIKRIKKGSDEIVFVFNNGMLQRKKFKGDFLNTPAEMTYYYTYNSDGVLEKKETISLSGAIVRYYSNYKFDSHGNWIKRIRKTKDGLPVGEARKITYY